MYCVGVNNLHFTVATVKCRLLTPTQYIGTEGLAIIAANIPQIIPVGGDPIPTTGNLTVVINGITRIIGANVTISGLNQSITKTTTFNNIAAGNYTVTPIVVTVGGVNYNPTGGGEIYVAPGQNAEIVIEYTKQSPPDANSIQIVQLYDTNGNILQQGTNVNVGERITVIANTYKNGNPANIGDVQFTVNNSQEGVQMIQGKSSGLYRATFTITEPGAINVTAFNQLGGSVTGQISAIRVSNYTIRINAPSTLIVGQCSPVSAYVLQDGVETNIPIQLDLSGLGIISNNPCGTEPPTLTPTGTTEPQILTPTGTTAGTIIQDTGAVGSGGVRPRGEFDQVASINQGINEI